MDIFNTQEPITTEEVAEMLSNYVPETELTTELAKYLKVTDNKFNVIKNTQLYMLNTTVLTDTEFKQLKPTSVYYIITCEYGLQQVAQLNRMLVRVNTSRVPNAVKIDEVFRDTSLFSNATTFGLKDGKLVNTNMVNQASVYIVEIKQ